MAKIYTSRFSVKTVYYNIYVVVAVTLFIFVGYGKSADDVLAHESLTHHNINSLAEEQYADYEQEKYREGEKLSSVQQTNEDVLAIGQAFMGFDEILSKEQNLLSEEQTVGNLVGDEEYDEDEDLAETEDNFEDEIFDQAGNEQMSLNEDEDTDHQSYSENLDDNNILENQALFLSEADELNDDELAINNMNDPEEADDEDISNGRSEEIDCDDDTDKDDGSKSRNDGQSKDKLDVSRGDGKSRDRPNVPRDDNGGKSKDKPDVLRDDNGGKSKDRPNVPRDDNGGKSKDRPDVPRDDDDGISKDKSDVSRGDGKPRDKPDDDQNNSKGSICSKISRLIKKLRSRGLISSKNSLVNFKANSRQLVYLHDFIPINGYNKLQIKSIKFNCATSFLSIETKPTPLWTIIPNYMSISRVAMSISFRPTTIHKTLRIIIKGIWRIGNLDIAVTADYNRASGITKIVAHPHPGTSLTSFVKGMTGLSLPVSSSVKISFLFEGMIHSNGAISLVLSSDKQRNKFYAIYKKPNKKSQPAKAIAVEVKQFRLSTLLRRLIKQDFSHTPFFGRLVVPDIGLIYSTGKMKIDGRKVFHKSPMLLTTKNEISKGLSAFIKVPFHNEPLIVKYQGKQLIITTPNRNLRLDRLLHYLLSGGRNRQVSFPLPQLKQLLRLYIEIMHVSRSSVNVIVSYPRPVVFFERFLKLSNVKANILVHNQRPRVSVEISGNIHLAGGTFKTKLAPNKQKKYTLTSVGDKLNINRIMQAFHSAVLPKKVQRFLKNIPFLRVVILKPRISYTFGARPQQMHIGGIPVVHGYRIVNIDLLLVKLYGRMRTIVAFELGSINLAETFSKLTGFNFRKFGLLNQRIHATVTLSPITSRQVHFSVGRLASLPIKKGFSLKATMKFPRNCGSDKFCKFAGRLIGHNTRLSIHGTILSATYYSITASLNNMRLGRGLNFNKAGLEIVGGSSSRIGLVGELNLKKPRLTFAARISVGTKGLSLQLSMTNCWHRAFGVEWLDVCNLLGAIDFAPPTAISGLALGAQLHLGYRSTRHQLKAKVYVGLSVNAVENYYYAKFNRLTMHSLLRAFKLNWHIPRPLGQSGFPHGFLSSFSFLGKQLPEVNLNIPAGFRLKGTLNILGLQGSADITIDLPKLIDINVALPPIRVGRLLAMYASSSDRRRGPYLKVKVQSIHRKVHIEASGYVKVLGISIEAKLKITNTQYEYFIRGKVLHLFEASMHITAHYGSIRKAHFRVRGEFKLDLFRGIKRIVGNLFRGIAKVATKALDAAKKVFQKISRLWEKAKNAVKRAWKKLWRIRRRMVVAELMASCSDESCRRALIQGWFRRTIRRATRYVRRTVRKVTRHVRKGYNYIKNKAKKLYSWAKQAWNKAKAVAKRYANKLKAARKALDWVKRAYRTGLKIFNYIRRHGLGGIINIRRLWFDISLKSASLGKFAGGIDLEFFGRHRLKLSVSFNLHKIGQLAKQLFHKLLRKVKRIFG